MARNYSLEIIGNCTFERAIEPNNLSIKVRDITFTPSMPTAGTMYIEYLDAYGNWVSFNSGAIDFTNVTTKPTPYITDELTELIRVRTVGVPDDTRVNIEVFANYVVQSSLDPRLTTRNNQFARLKTESLSTVQQLTLDGLTVEWWWRIRAAAKNTRYFAKFTIPDGFYLAVFNRVFNLQIGEAYYRVYRGSDVDSTGEVLGAELPIKSLMRSDTNLTIPTVAYNVTLPIMPSKDSSIVELAEFAAQSQGNSSSSELDSDDSFRLLQPNAVFYIEMNNISEISYIKTTLLFALLRADFTQPPIEFDE